MSNYVNGTQQHKTFFKHLSKESNKSKNFMEISKVIVQIISFLDNSNIFFKVIIYCQYYCIPKMQNKCQISNTKRTLCLRYK